MLTKHKKVMAGVPTAAGQAKAAGIKSLKVVSEVTAVNVQTLNNWHKNKPNLFNVVLQGTITVLNDKQAKQDINQ